MVDKVRDYIEKSQMLEKGDTIILGISGGADSVCLLFVLLELQAEYDLQLIGVHVNHNLRGEEAIRDQEYVKQICHKYQVQCIVRDVDVVQEAARRKQSLEEAGREVRQEAFQEVAEQWRKQLGGEFSKVKVATAHHSNDNAETMLMNLARGTGISGLTGIAPICGNRIRPLLCVSREEIEVYLQNAQIAFCTDHTNLENIYTRNIVRNEVIPKLEQGVNEQVVRHMNQAMEELARIEEFLIQQVNERWDLCVEQKGASLGILLYKERMELQDLIIQERIVKRALEIVAGKQKDIGRVHVSKVLELLDKQVGKEIHLPYRVIGRRVYEGVLLSIPDEVDSQKKITEESIELGLSGNTYWSENCIIRARVFDRNTIDEIHEKLHTKYFDYDIITEVPCVRTRRIGDYIAINSRGNTQALKKYYVTNKVPACHRDEIPLITIGSEVLWIVGQRKSAGYEINKNTKRVLEIQYEGGDLCQNKLK